VQLRQIVWAMLAAVILVLLIACVNVMNMQFGRAALRAKELAIRGALGATRWRLVRQMLTESFVVAVFGTLAGVILAYWSVDLLARAIKAAPFPPPYWWQFTIDGRVLAFTLVITLVATIASGLVPAFLSSRGNAAEIMKEGGRGNSSRLVNVITRVLVVGQIALTAALLIAARLIFELLLAIGIVYRGTTVDQPILAFGILIASLLCVIALAFVRLTQKQIVLGLLLLCLCYVPFAIPPMIDPSYLRFWINKASYLAIMESDRSPPPKYRVFSWGNHNTTFGGGVVFQAIVYDESDEIGRAPGARSLNWIERRSNPSAEDRWIYTTPDKYSYSCRRRTAPLGEHFYYVEEEC